MQIHFHAILSHSWDLGTTGSGPRLNTCAKLARLPKMAYATARAYNEGHPCVCHGCHGRLYVDLTTADLSAVSTRPN